MPLALIFDVETTGLIPKNPTPGNVPYIIQISFLLYDTENEEIKQVYNEYISIPPSVVLKPEITDLTGIHRETLDTKGIDIVDALKAFLEAYLVADMVVAHNIEFDITMIMTEASIHYRLLVDTFHKDQRTLEKSIYCTMRRGTDLCKLERINSRGVYLKLPKLSELYTHLFKTDPPKGLHNSMIDVLACLRCFMEMKMFKTIEDAVFEKYLVEYS